MRELYVDFLRTCDDESISYQLKITVRRAIEAALDIEGFDRSAHVSVTFCDNKYIHKLNKQHRSVDRHTDVLSFPMYTRSELSQPVCEPVVMLGDVVISLERAREQAQEIGNTFFREVAFLTVHSILHLLGYDHELSEQEDELQRSRQRLIMDRLDTDIT